ncbi:leucine-zipper-like transcriptional regulator 1 homolog [Belonocnema kinseyi]|uniref:leucine-zipper-like transcriptional regulator 1 homolog n=1 Tax=Belonocnema kinseyi TaxID=2817044 RepID=UPI00143DEEB0|nr:leucine-zipper-like transcriptional regulator 1 homolog [Belonocnema kinseyi]
MVFSEVPDTSFTWIIPDFENVLKSSNDISFYSPNFTTSQDPNRKWYMFLCLEEKSTEHCDRCKTYEKYLKNRDEISIRVGKNSPVRKKSSTVKDTQQNATLQRICNPKFKKKRIYLKFKCDELFGEALELKVQISIVNPTGKMFSRSFILSGDEVSYVFNDFIDPEDLGKFLDNGKLEILAEIFFPERATNRKNFEDCLNVEFLSDVQLLIGEDRISAHKVILASKSPFFNELFLHNKEVNVEDINPEAFKEILKYIYTGKIENWSLSCEILAGASKLQIEDLKFECEQRLRKNLTVKSVISILILAEDSNAECLKQHCLCYVLHHVNDIKKSETFQSLKSEPGLILEILRRIFNKFSKGEIRIFNNIKLSNSQTATSRCCEFLQDYEPFFNSETLSDIEIHVGEKKYRSHKLILAARSPVFRGMLMSNMKEALSNFVEIKDMSADVFEELLRHMYTGKVENLQNLGLEILKAADKYDLDHLKNVCEEFINKRLTHENVVNIVKIADTHNANFLKEQCIYFTVKEMVYLAKKKKSFISIEDFVETHPHILYEILTILSKLCHIEYQS